MRPYIILLATFLLLPAAAHSDIIRLKDGSALNGKIIQQSNADVIFASATATITVQRETIADIFKTESAAEDHALLEKLGKSVSKNDIEKDYYAGQKKLDQFLETGIIVTAPRDVSSAAFGLSLYGGPARSFSTLSSAVPWGGYAGIHLDARYTQNPPQLEHFLTADVLMCRFSRGGNILSGGIIAGGYTLGLKLKPALFIVSAAAGPGLFRIDDSLSPAWKLTAAAWADAGVRFNVERITLSPVVRTLYAHDSEAPLIGVSILFMAGYEW
jgi:hypothetical protein